VRYVIHRLCRSSGSPDAANNSCLLFHSTAGASSNRGQLSYGASKRFQSSDTVYYRITVHVRGPRHTTAFVQPLVHFKAFMMSSDRRLRRVLASLCLMYVSSSFALTDLAQAPINFLLATPVKPNIYSILDDSGSMQWSFLGDEVVSQQYQNAVGYRASACNKIYYNP